MKPSPYFDLAVDSWQKLARDAEFDDLKEAVKRLPAWTADAAANLDAVHIDRVIRLIASRHAAREDFNELIFHLGWMAHDRFRDQLNAFPARYFDRWRTLRDLVVARREAVEHGDKTALAGRKHVAAVIDLLSGEALPQSEIGQRLGLGKVNLTRVLNLMESAGLIERRKEGTEKRVFLAGAEARASERKAHPPEPPPVTYLFRPAVAA
jgi:hypothetical protein